MGCSTSKEACCATATSVEGPNKRCDGLLASSLSENCNSSNNHNNTTPSRGGVVGGGANGLLSSFSSHSPLRGGGGKSKSSTVCGNNTSQSEEMDDTNNYGEDGILPLSEQSNRLSSYSERSGRSSSSHRTSKSKISLSKLVHRRTGSPSKTATQSPSSQRSSSGSAASASSSPPPSLKSSSLSTLAQHKKDGSVAAVAAAENPNHNSTLTQHLSTLSPDEQAPTQSTPSTGHNNVDGIRILLMGPQGSGKMTIVRHLRNYSLEHEPYQQQQQQQQQQQTPNPPPSATGTAAVSRSNSLNMTPDSSGQFSIVATTNNNNNINSNGAYSGGSVSSNYYYSSKGELELYRAAIRSNIVTFMQHVLYKLQMLGLQDQCMVEKVGGGPQNPIYRPRRERKRKEREQQRRRSSGNGGGIRAALTTTGQEKRFSDCGLASKRYSNEGIATKRNSNEGMAFPQQQQQQQQQKRNSNEGMISIQKRYSNEGMTVQSKRYSNEGMTYQAAKRYSNEGMTVQSKRYSNEGIAVGWETKSTFSDSKSRGYDNNNFLFRGENPSDNNKNPTNPNEPYCSGVGANDATSRSCSISPKKPNKKVTEWTTKRAYKLLAAHLLEGRPLPVDCAERDDDDSYDSDSNSTADDWIGKSHTVGGEMKRNAQLFERLWQAIQIVWETRTMQFVWSRRGRDEFVDEHKEFLDDIARIADPNYQPTESDKEIAILQHRGLLIERFRLFDQNYEIYNLGSYAIRKSRNWMQHLHNIRFDCVVFVADLSSYDETVESDDEADDDDDDLHPEEDMTGRNQMDVALDLWKKVVNDPVFAKIPKRVLLNKNDIFAEKVVESDVGAQTAFQDYRDAPWDYYAGLNYFIERFKECVEDNYSNNVDKKSSFDDSCIRVISAISDGDSWLRVFDPRSYGS